MLLAADIGNSAIKFGVFDGEKLTNKFSIPTKRESTADEVSTAVNSVKAARIDSVIVCSVVPDVNDSIAAFILEATGREPVFVTNTFDFGLKINYEPLESLGTDRLVNAFAAVEKYGPPCIVCSLGTATTIDVVNDKRVFLGGVIAPGLDAMAGALHVKAPRLPHLEVEQPSTMIGNSTTDSMQSGL